MNGRRDKLLLIGALPPPYIGPSIAAQQILASKTIARDFEVVFCDISDHRGLESVGRFDWRNLWLGLAHTAKCVGLLLSRRPRLVYLGVSQDYWGFLRDLGFLIPAVLLRRRIAVHLRGSEFGDFYRRMPSGLRGLTRFLFHRVSCAIVLSERLKGVFAGLVARHRIQVVPNGVDCDLFRPGGRNGEDESRGQRILWVSNLFRRKGVEHFLGSLPMVLPHHPQARVTVAGEWESSALRQEMTALLDSYGLSSRVAFVGRADSPRKCALYREHDIFVLPPVQPEGMPWAILEAMSSGLPVISSAQGAIPDAVVDGRTGFLVSPTAENIAARLNFLLAHPETAQQMGQEGRRRVQKLFSREKSLTSLARSFQRALSD